MVYETYKRVSASWAGGEQAAPPARRSGGADRRRALNPCAGALPPSLFPAPPSPRRTAPNTTSELARGGSGCAARVLGWGGSMPLPGVRLQLAGGMRQPRLFDACLHASGCAAAGVKPSLQAGPLLRAG